MHLGKKHQAFHASGLWCKQVDNYQGTFVQHTLVIQLARLGDILQTKRLMLSLQQPDTTVHLCVDSSLLTFAQRVFPMACVHGIPAHATSTVDAEKIFTRSQQAFLQLRHIPFTNVYLLNASPLSYAIARLFPHEIVHGYSCPDGQPMRSLWSKLASRWSQDRRYAPVNLVDMWAFFMPSPIAPEHVNPAATPCGNKRIGVVMAGQAARRSLPAPVLAHIVQALFQAHDGPEIFCLGSAKERPLVRQLSRHLTSAVLQKIRDTTGTTKIDELPELMQSFDCVLSPDTGLLHLAAHVGVPTHSFFLSSAWCFETGPYGAGHTIWQATAPCSPCIESQACHYNTRCLAPFSDHAFLQQLTGKNTSHLPQNMTKYTTNFDELGVCYTAQAGTDPYFSRRMYIRKLLMEYALHNPAHELPQEIGSHFYHEADWMLPSQ